MFGRSLGRLGNRVAGRLVRLLERMYFTSINDIRAEHGLPPTTLAATYRKQAAGLRAGVPAVPIPMTGDGPFWSHRLRMLGAGPGAIRFKKLTTDRLAGAVSEAVTNPGYTRRAAELAATIGAAAVVTAVARGRS